MSQPILFFNQLSGAFITKNKQNNLMVDDFYYYMFIICNLLK